MKEKTLEELKVLFKKVNDNADNEIALINTKIEGLREQISEIDYTRSRLLGELRDKMNEATKKKYEKMLLK